MKKMAVDCSYLVYGRLCLSTFSQDLCPSHDVDFPPYPHSFCLSLSLWYTGVDKRKMKSEQRKAAWSLHYGLWRLSVSWIRNREESIWMLAAVALICSILCTLFFLWSVAVFPLLMRGFFYEKNSLCLKESFLWKSRLLPPRGPAGW